MTIVDAPTAVNLLYEPQTKMKSKNIKAEKQKMGALKRNKNYKGGI